MAEQHPSTQQTTKEQEARAHQEEEGARKQREAFGIPENATFNPVEPPHAMDKVDDTEVTSIHHENRIPDEPPPVEPPPEGGEARRRQQEREREAESRRKDR